MGLFSGLLAGVGSALVGGLFSSRSASVQEANSRAQVAAQDRTNAMNAQVAREINQRSYEQNLDLWNRQNAYNTPLAQMERFKAAGLNPHLIYSQSSMAGPIASPSQPVPEYKEQAMTKADRAGLFLNYLQQYQDLRNSRAQEQLIQAQKNFAVQQAMSSATNRDLSVLANARADAQFELAKSLGDASMRQTDAQINFLQTRNALGRNDLETYEERHPIASVIKKARDTARDTKKVWSQIGDYASKRGYLRTIGDLIGW